MRVITTFFGPHAPYALTSCASTFSHNFKRFERFVKLATSSVMMSRRRVRGARGPGAAALGRGQMGPQDVCNAGTGTAESRVVTRCKSALTGQDVGRWRRIRSWDGWAVARVVCDRVGVRSA
jgi:hypothetical protein